MCAMVCLPSIRWRYMGSGLAVSLILSISIETPTLPLISVEKHNSVVLGHAELTMWCWEKTEWQFFTFLSKVVVLVIHTTFLVCPYVCHVSVSKGIQSHNCMMLALSDLADIFLCLGKCELVPTGKGTKGEAYVFGCSLHRLFGSSLPKAASCWYILELLIWPLDQLTGSCFSEAGKKASQIYLQAYQCFFVERFPGWWKYQPSRCGMLPISQMPWQFNKMNLFISQTKGKASAGNLLCRNHSTSFMDF